LLDCLEHLLVTECKGMKPNVSCQIIDRAVAVQITKPKIHRRFDEYASQVFVPYIKSQLQCVECLDLVLDRYMPDSLKANARS
jgi:hypothetical protein